MTTEVQDTTDSLISKIPQREDWKNETPSSLLPRLLTRHFEHDEWFAGSVRAVAQLKMSWSEYHNILLCKQNMLQYCKHKNTVLLKSRDLESK